LDKYQYDVSIQPAAFTGSASGRIKVKSLDTSKTTTVRVIRGGVQQLIVSAISGGDSFEFGFATLTSGDQIEVQQPSGTVQETFTVPTASISGTAGSAAVTGNAPDGATAFVTQNDICFGWETESYPVTPVGNAFSHTYPRALLPGSELHLDVLPGKGDRVRYNDRLAGETPCITVAASAYAPVQGESPDPTPYSFQSFGFHPSVGTGARIVLRRGAAALADFSDAGTVASIGTQTAERPQAGDVIEVYRPNTAPTPSATFTIPAVKGTYDPGNSLVAVDAPAASFLIASGGTFYAQYSNQRGAVGTANGRTILDFAQPQSYYSAADLSTVDYLDVDWYSPDRSRRFTTNAVPADLTPPILKLKLALKFKVAKLVSSVPVSVTSSEAANAKLQLTLPAKLKTSGAKKAKKPTVVASATFSLKAGTKKLKLKLTKSGKRLLKKLRTQHLPAQTATLTVTATDAAGNAATKVKTTKLVSQ
jgi:hypothetical protein